MMVSLLGFAAERAYVMSIPYALSDNGIYKVGIVEIDGEVPRHSIKHPVNRGEHTVTVGLVLEVKWTPNLTGPQEKTFLKKIDLTIEDDMNYEIGAEVNVDAPLESQLDGSFWEPILYRAY